MAMLECQLWDSTLFVQKLPVDNSTLGVIDHHSGYCCQTFSTRGKQHQALFLSLVVEPYFWARVCDATWDSSDAEMRKLAYRARGTHAQFHVISKYGFELIYKDSQEQSRLVVLSSCQQVLLDEVHNAHVRVEMAVQRLAQHATLHSTSQHPCALQHNATTGTTYIPSVVTVAIGGTT